MISMIQMGCQVS